LQAGERYSSWKGTNLLQKENVMKIQIKHKNEGALGWGILWLLGVPVSVLLVLFLLRGCT
jgi:hypothetical protein